LDALGISRIGVVGTLHGENGNDTLDGGTGNDALDGGAGNDTYVFGHGSGQDTVSDYDTTPGNTDAVAFASNLTADQLWFRRMGNNLEVSILGTDDKLTVNNWYSGSAHHVEQFRTSDSKVLLDSQVDVLVAAMAGFAPPAPGQTSLPPDYQAALNPVIAANWK
ncbi:calcium-binding protein, partial [Variovorax sp. WDL1]